MSDFGIQVRKNVVWLYFKAPSGKSALISCESLANKYGPITGDAIKEWADSLLRTNP